MAKRALAKEKVFATVSLLHHINQVTSRELKHEGGWKIIIRFINTNLRRYTKQNCAGHLYVVQKLARDQQNRQAPIKLADSIDRQRSLYHHPK